MRRRFLPPPSPDSLEASRRFHTASHSPSQHLAACPRRGWQRGDEGLPFRLPFRLPFARWLLCSLGPILWLRCPRWLLFCPCRCQGGSNLKIGCHPAPGRRIASRPKGLFPTHGLPRDRSEDGLQEQKWLASSSCWLGTVSSQKHFSARYSWSTKLFCLAIMVQQGTLAQSAVGFSVDT